jgi:hypothetical protein
VGAVEAQRLLLPALVALAAVVEEPSLPLAARVAVAQRLPWHHREQEAPLEHFLLTFQRQIL